MAYAKTTLNNEDSTSISTVQHYSSVRLSGTESQTGMEDGSKNYANQGKSDVSQCGGCHKCDSGNKTITRNSKQAEETVTPFLARHGPKQYAPLGSSSIIFESDRAAQHTSTNGVDESRKQTESPNTKYCYRHRPDMRCRRQADEPSMEQLQAELGSLSQEDQQGLAHVWALFSAAPSKHRNLILRGILAQCCFQQLSFLSAAVRDMVKIDFISALPTELGYRIFCYLDTISLCKAAQVSQRWRSLADDDVVWHRMCEQHIDRKCTECGWGLPLLERKRLRTEKRQNQLRAEEKDFNHLPNKKSTLISNGSEPSTQDNLSHKISVNGKRSAEEDSTLSLKRACTEPNRLGAQSPRPSRPWKDVYKARFKVGTNWKHGRCTLKILKGHTNGIMCMQLDDHAHILATGSYDATIKIWDLRSGDCIRTLTGHTSGVRCLQFDDNRLISGSIDRTLRVWNWRSPSGNRDISNDNDYSNDDGNDNTIHGSPDYCLRTLTGHAGGVIGLHFDGNVLASGSTDRTVRIWDTGSRNTFLLRGHTDWVNAVRIDARSRTCFSASDDCTIRLWSLDSRSCLRTFEGHVGQVQQLVLMPPEFEPSKDGDTHNDGCGNVHAPVARRMDEDGGRTPLSNEYDHTRSNVDDSITNGTRNDIISDSSSTAVLQSRPVHALSSHFVTGSSPSSSSTPPPSLSTTITSSSRTTLSSNQSNSTSSSTLQSNLLVTPLPSPIPSSTSAFAPPTATTPSQPPSPSPPTYFLTSSLDSTLRLWSTAATTDTSSPSPPPASLSSSSSSHIIPCPSHSHCSSSTPRPNLQQAPTPISHPLRTFFGHVEGVWALAADTLRAVSGAEDRTVKIWDPRTGACLRTFAGHEAPVTCVALGDCRLVSGGEDCDIRVLGFGS